MLQGTTQCSSTQARSFPLMAGTGALATLSGQVCSLAEHLWMLLMSALYPGSRFFLMAAALAADWAAALLASITSPVSRACWASTCSQQTPAGASGQLKLCWGLCILIAAAVHGSASPNTRQAGNVTLQLWVGAPPAQVPFQKVRNLAAAAAAQSYLFASRCFVILCPPGRLQSSWLHWSCPENRHSCIAPGRAAGTATACATAHPRRCCTCTSRAGSCLVPASTADTRGIQCCAAGAAASACASACPWRPCICTSRKWDNLFDASKRS